MVQRKCMLKYWRSEGTATKKHHNLVHIAFQKTEFFRQIKHQRRSKINPRKIIDGLKDEPNHFLWRAANKVMFFHTQKMFQSTCHQHIMAYLLSRPSKYLCNSRKAFAESMRDDLGLELPQFHWTLGVLKGGYFRFEWVFNIPNCRHWVTINSYCTIEKTLTH